MLSLFARQEQLQKEGNYALPFMIGMTKFTTVFYSGQHRIKVETVMQLVSLVNSLSCGPPNPITLLLFNQHVSSGSDFVLFFPKGHSAMSGCTFDSYNWYWDLFLKVNGERPGIMLNVR